ncbi:MAG: nucleotidyl transferase AbiEii/AbiGii toxin family protein [Stackebrandtia sp.]
MTNRPTRETVAGRAYLDLQNLARRRRRPTDELHQIYALEGFLARLAVSAYRDSFILKGGVLLAAYNSRRPTRDVDLQAQQTHNDETQILNIIRSIADLTLDDGLEFDVDGAAAQTIRETDAYSGVRVTLAGRLSAAKLSLHVDVGDPIHPPQRIVLPRLLHGDITLNGYPLPMILAEKLVIAMQRGTTNTRWRDFADIYTLIRRHDVDPRELTEAIEHVTRHRLVRPSPLREVLDGFEELGQRRWTAWRRKQQLETSLPESFGEVLRAVCAFADPVLDELSRN